MDRIGLFFCRMDASQHCIQSLTVEIPAVHDDCPNLLRIRNVVERICIEQHQICELSSFSRSSISASWRAAAPVRPKATIR